MDTAKPNANPLAHLPAGKLSGELLEVLSHFIDATERCRVLDDVVAVLTGRERVPTDQLRALLRDELKRWPYPACSYERLGGTP